MNLNYEATKNKQLLRFCEEHGLSMRADFERNIHFLTLTKMVRHKKKWFWSKLPEEREVKIGSIQGLGSMNIYSREISYSWVPFEVSAMYLYGVDQWPNGYFSSGNEFKHLFLRFVDLFNAIYIDSKKST
jgi:hypothetical protein